MSESNVKKGRSVQDIQEEYTRLCAKAGHLQYQVFTHSKDLEMVNETLRELNIEASQQAATEQAYAAQQAVAQVAAVEEVK